MYRFVFIFFSLCERTKFEEKLGVRAELLLLFALKYAIRLLTDVKPYLLTDVLFFFDLVRWPNPKKSQ